MNCQLNSYLPFPDFETVWIGAHYTYGQWIWMSTGTSLESVTDESGYPPWRSGKSERNDGCLLLDRHIDNTPSFVETRCDRKRDFICEECTFIYYILTTFTIYLSNHRDNKSSAFNKSLNANQFYL